MQRTRGRPRTFDRPMRRLTVHLPEDILRDMEKVPGYRTFVRETVVKAWLMRGKRG